MTSILGTVATGNDINQTSITTAHTLGAGSNIRLIAVTASEDSGDPVPAISGVTYNGIAMTEILQTVTGSGSFKNVISVHELKDSQLPASGVYNCVATLVSANTAEYIWQTVFALEDATQADFVSSDYDIESLEGVTSNAFSPGVSVESDDYVIAAVTDGDGRNFTIDDVNYTEHQDDDLGGAGYACYSKAITATSTETPTLTADGSCNRFNAFLLRIQNYFEITSSATPSPMQDLSRQFASISASKFDGVLQ